MLKQLFNSQKIFILSLAIIFSYLGWIVFQNFSPRFNFSSSLGYSENNRKSTLTAASPSLNISAVPNVTTYLQDLGDPFISEHPNYMGKGVYRNVWDMRLFGKRVYLAHGDINENTGSLDNAGTPIYYYDISARKFVNQFRTEDEGLYFLKIYNGALLTPGADAMESFDFGNFYRLEQDVWKKYRTVPCAPHVLDMVNYTNLLFASATWTCLGNNISTVRVSNDNGQTFTEIPLTSSFGSVTSSGPFFEINGNLYLQVSFIDNSIEFLRWNGTSFESSGIDPLSMYPDLVEITKAPTIQVNSLQFSDHLVYLGKSWFWGDPFGLWVASSPTNARRVQLSLDGTTPARPMDIIVVKEKVKRIVQNVLYVMTSTKLGDSNYVTGVFKTTDLNTWTPVLQFTKSTISRSFEYQNGNFYFGMGSEDPYLNWSSITTVDPLVGHIFYITGRDIKNASALNL